jgi:hypothetical protein
MTPEQIEALPRDYSKRVKDRINATILAGQVNNAQNDAGNFIFSRALPAGLTIAGLGPFGSLVNSMGFLPALGTTAASIGGGYLGATGLGYVGRKIDEKYGTKLEPWMSMGGGFLGGYLGAAGGYGLSSKIAQYNAYKPWAEKVFSPEMLFDAKQAIYRNQLANLRDHEIRMNKPNTYETVLLENGPTINAAGNAEGIIINPLVNRIYNLQVTKGSMYNRTRPSRVGSISSSQYNTIMKQIRDAVSKTSKSNKLAQDVAQIKSLQSSRPQHNSLESLIYFNKDFSDKSLLGQGVESFVYKMGTDPNYVYKVPKTGYMIGNKTIRGASIEEMYKNAKNYVDDFNQKYIYQEPLSLVGYTRFK